MSSLFHYLSLCGSVLACDTESLPHSSPYCVTLSHTPGTGRLIYAHDTHTLSQFRDWLTTWPGLLLFHNYLHDVSQFSSLSLPIHQFRDTMVLAYELCLGGGGDDEDTESKAGRGSLSLKILAHRHLAMSMTSFQDTVYPWSKPYLTRYLSEARDLLAPGPKLKKCVCGHLQLDHVPQGKTQRPLGMCVLCGCPKCKLAKVKSNPNDKLPGLLHRKVSSLIGKIATDPDCNPWRQMKDWHDHDHDMLEMVMGGPAPVPSVEHVPEPELLRYAIRDADATLRLYYFLQEYAKNPWLFY